VIAVAYFSVVVAFLGDRVFFDHRRWRARVSVIALVVGASWIAGEAISPAQNSGAPAPATAAVGTQSQGTTNVSSPSGQAQTAGAQPAGQPAAAPLPPADYIGAEVCSRCHYDKFISYQNIPMSMSGNKNTPAAHEGCESCHGPASNHVGGGGGRGVGGLMNFTKEKTTAAKNAVCLTCHTRGYTALWHGSKHDEAKLACVDCHQIHGGNQKLLAQPTQLQLCTRCHEQIRTALLKPSHHPLREEKMVCTNCHNPHGTQTERLIAANSVNDKCYECHGEKRGPFLWEHPPVRESCLNCHDPHGTSHEPLLVVKKPMLCQRCHSNVFHPGQLLTVPGGQGTSVYQQPAMLQYRACTNCHIMIHGSNHPSGKFFHR
jgi:DmsE family decaheme c-type cytochrome